MAPNEDNTFNSETYGGSFAATHADDEEEHWYYADGEGKLYSGAIKKIKGKYYAFRPDDGDKGAAMLNGLVLMKVLSDGTIDEIADDSVDSDDLSDILDGTTDVEDGFSLYYFGNDEDSDGAMKTGNTTVTLDGDTYNFMFSKTGGAEGKGKGLHGIYDEKSIYMYGCKLKAGSDDKYIVAYADKDTGSDDATVIKYDSKDIRNAVYSGLTESEDTNKDGDTVRAIRGFSGNCYLLNTSGTIVKNKTAARDGDDWYFYVDDKNVIQYTNNKSLKNTIFENWKPESK